MPSPIPTPVLIGSGSKGLSVHLDEILRSSHPLGTLILHKFEVIMLNSRRILTLIVATKLQLIFFSS